MSEKKQSPAREDDEAVQFGDELPVLPIRNAVLFPGAVAPFDVGREKSVALVEDVDNLPSPVIAIFAQRDPSTDPWYMGAIKVDWNAPFAHLVSNTSYF